MSRVPVTKSRGHRELWIVGLLVLPLVVLGFVLAAMGVLVDPPPDPTPTPTIERGSPAASPGTPAATPAPDARIDDQTTDRRPQTTGVLFTVAA